jgi:large subunit ribosomal protein L25
MADRITLEARKRTVLGKKVKQIRRLGKLPATVYGHEVSPESIEVDSRSFRTAYTAAGDNQLIDLVLEGQRPRPVLVHSTQIDPRKNVAIHVEFYQANLREKLTAHIPIHLVGEAPAVKEGLTVLSVLDSVELECLPTDLPHDIEVDISGLAAVGESIHVGDLQVDRTKCEIKTDPEEVVVLISAPQVQEEEEVAEEAEEGAEAAASAESTTESGTSEGDSESS